MDHAKVPGCRTKRTNNRHNFLEPFSAKRRVVLLRHNFCSESSSASTRGAIRRAASYKTDTAKELKMMAESNHSRDPMVQRSKSIAIQRTCPPDDDGDDADADAFVYEQRTWRMYHRITNYRQNQKKRLKDEAATFQPDKISDSNNMAPYYIQPMNMGRNSVYEYCTPSQFTLFPISLKPVTSESSFDVHHPHLEGDIFQLDL